MPLVSSRPGGDKKVDLRPVCFETTGLDRINAHVPVKFTQFIAKCNRIPKTQRKPRCVLGRHKDVIAPGACQRIFVAQHNAVELPAATGSKMELPCWDTFLWELQRAELSFSIWREELIGQQPASAQRSGYYEPLSPISAFYRPLDVPAIDAVALLRHPPLVLQLRKHSSRR